MSARATLVLAALVCAGCGEREPPAAPPADPPPKHQTPDADRFDVRTDPVIEWTVRGEGPEVKVGDVVDVHYEGSLPDGRVFDSTRARNLPFAFEAGRGKVIPGLDRVIVRLRVGDRAKTVIPAPLAYGAIGIPGSIPPETPLTYDLEVLRVIPRPTWEVLATGEGPPVRFGATVALHYETYHPDGKKVDSSRAGAPYKFRAGTGEVIEGWDRTVLRMRVGDRWKVTVPWFFAYGAEGSLERKVPARQDFVFDLEVMGVE